MIVEIALGYVLGKIIYSIINGILLGILESFIRRDSVEKLLKELD